MAPSLTIQVGVGIHIGVPLLSPPSLMISSRVVVLLDQQSKGQSSPISHWHS